jgi:hypothetical protein
MELRVLGRTAFALVTIVSAQTADNTAVIEIA